MPSQAPSRFATIVGRNIRAARDAAELTQSQLAAKVGVDPMLVSKWERGRHRPTDANLALVATHTGRELVWFYTDHQTTRRAAA